MTDLYKIILYKIKSIVCENLRSSGSPKIVILKKRTVAFEQNLQFQMPITNVVGTFSVLHVLLHVYNVNTRIKRTKSKYAHKILHFSLFRAVIF